MPNEIPNEPSWSESVTTLPPNRRYICTHDANGKSIVHSAPAQQYISAQIGGMARSYSTVSVPAVLKDDQDVDEYLAPEGITSHKTPHIVVPNGQGSNLVVVDLLPGGKSEMHRTLSIDYSICVIGHVRMELDGGEMLDMRPGDHVIQRGTMHKWWNGSMTEPARFVAVTLPCEPFKLPGTAEMLKEEWV
ncbi:hypothetical protein EJ04DRAFT_571977 [Polyplosphaeria fusca]|uniref:Uncharacterized protein n=1 Tax=Polyplosphaeria fusca TaxID=682080 RepID=A0A9P4V796_9PLEO|nr:hypothetical protein EJ04DRAFT_571977 [Polyplosphaeria fusca]